VSVEGEEAQPGSTDPIARRVPMTSKMILLISVSSSALPHCHYMTFLTEIEEINTLHSEVRGYDRALSESSATSTGIPGNSIHYIDTLILGAYNLPA
jgi:hypothetical protein